MEGVGVSKKEEGGSLLKEPQRTVFTTVIHWILSFLKLFNFKMLLRNLEELTSYFPGCT